MSRSIPSIAVLLVAALSLTGCIGMLSGAEQPDTAADDAATAAEAMRQTQAAMANASANMSASGNMSANSTKYDDANCMVGMDMPGCPAWYAEKRYQEQAAKTPPDKTLPSIKIILDKQGAGQEGKITVDNGTMHLLITSFVNDTGAGPYAALGPGGQGDLTVTLKGPAGVSKLITLSGTANTAGADPATTLAKGPYAGIITMPAEGVWTVTVNGQGTNVGVTLALVETFSM